MHAKFARRQSYYEFITWMNNGMDPDHQKLADLYLQCSTKRDTRFENFLCTVYLFRTSFVNITYRFKCHA